MSNAEVGLIAVWLIGIAITFTVGRLITLWYFKINDTIKLLTDLVEIQKEQLRIIRKVYPDQSALVIEERKAKEKK